MSDSNFNEDNVITSQNLDEYNFENNNPEGQGDEGDQDENVDAIGDEDDYEDEDEEDITPPSPLQLFRASIRGEVVTESDGVALYDESKQIWNGDWEIPNRPLVIVHCRGVSDVQRCIQYAKEQKLEVTVRCGGYSLRGLSTNAGGLVIDLGKNMRSVKVDVEGKTVWFEGGCRVKDVDAETIPFGMVTPLGSVGNVGCGGLVSGGGYGYLTRSRGLAVDNVISMDVVLPNGEFVTCSETEHPDLFWACRGAQSNFGVITGFNMKTYNCPTEIYAGLVLYDIVHAKTIIETFESFAKTMENECNAHLYCMPLTDTQKLIALQLCYLGDTETGSTIFQPLINCAPCVENQMKSTTYAAYQLFSDDLYKIQGIPSYWRSKNVKLNVSLPVDKILKVIDNAPPEGIFVIEHYGGKANEPAEDSCAYPHRSHEFVATFTGFGYRNPTARALVKDWIDQSTMELKDYFLLGGYVNYNATNKEVSYGANMQRLREVKTKYDPENFFKCNVNISPLPSLRENS